MNRESLRALLERVQRGETTMENALGVLEKLPYEDLDFVRIDHHRQIRTGMPEVVFGEGKEPGQIAIIVEKMSERESNVLVTRLSNEKADDVLKLVANPADYTYDPVSRTLCRRNTPFKDVGRGVICVACAGTSDLPVAREALVTAEMMNNRVKLLTDIGVAGLHRLLSVRDTLMECEIIIAVAGMEGALPGVLAGLVDRPVIGVPTSVGYGVAFHGLSSLMTMLNSCAPGLAVVNIDNGYGAAAMASQMNRVRT